MKITVDMIMMAMPYPSDTRSLYIDLWNGRESLSPAEIMDLHISIDDRRCLLGALVDINDPTMSVIRRFVRDVIGCSIISPAYQAWLDTGDESLRPAAYYDSFGYTTIFEIAASDAADTAYTAACAAYESSDILTGVAAMEKYLGWMVEFLEGLAEEMEI